MSVERVRRKDGKVVYRVRWRENQQNRSRTYSRREDARTADAEITRRKRLGTLAELDAGRETLDAFVSETWGPVHAAQLAATTRATYATIYAKHIGPHLGAMPLRALTPDTIAGWQAQRLKSGAGPESIRKARGLLGGIMQRAVEHGRIPVNSARQVRGPRRRPRSEVRPLPPVVVERMRATLEPSDAVLMSVLAYAGLRPGEALDLQWVDVRERTLLIHAPKTSTMRTVRLLQPLAQDLAEWRMRSGRPADRTLVFPRPHGGEWSEHDWRNWRKRRFTPAVEAAGVEHVARPYDLRHSFASLLLAEGHTVHYVARQLGHAPSMTLDVYGHVIDELEGRERIDAETEIRAARGERRTSLVPFRRLSRHQLVLVAAENPC